MENIHFTKKKALKNVFNRTKYEYFQTFHIFILNLIQKTSKFVFIS